RIAVIGYDALGKGKNTDGTGSDNFCDVPGRHKAPHFYSVGKRILFAKLIDFAQIILRGAVTTAIYVEPALFDPSHRFQKDRDSLPSIELPAVTKEIGLFLRGQLAGNHGSIMNHHRSLWHRGLQRRKILERFADKDHTIGMLQDKA